MPSRIFKGLNGENDQRLGESGLELYHIFVCIVAQKDLELSPRRTMWFFIESRITSWPSGRSEKSWMLGEDCENEPVEWNNLPEQDLNSGQFNYDKHISVISKDESSSLHVPVLSFFWVRSQRRQSFMKMHKCTKHITGFPVRRRSWWCSRSTLWDLLPLHLHIFHPLVLTLTKYFQVPKHTKSFHSICWWKTSHIILWQYLNVTFWTYSAVFMEFVTHSLSVSDFELHFLRFSVTEA